jgi:hypothetical protein
MRGTDIPRGFRFWTVDPVMAHRIVGIIEGMGVQVLPTIFSLTQGFMIP